MQVGEISSGAFSPCLKKNIAMGYVKKGHGKVGTKLKVSTACAVDTMVGMPCNAVLTFPLLVPASVSASSFTCPFNPR